MVCTDGFRPKDIADPEEGLRPSEDGISGMANPCLVVLGRRTDAI
jgi:hypothetical protein